MARSEENSDDPTEEPVSETTKQKTTYVAESSERTAVLKRLVDGPGAASEIATKRSTNLSNARKTTESTASLGVSSTESRAEQLREEGLVERLVTDETTAYGLTAMGERVVFSLEREGKL